MAIRRRHYHYAIPKIGLTSDFNQLSWFTHSGHLARATLQGLQIRKGANELLASLALGNTESRARLGIDRLDIADRASLSVENANASL